MNGPHSNDHVPQATSHTGQSAAERDETDPLRCFRNAFLFPTTEGREDLYFVGNSLGLQPRRTAGVVQQVLDQWQSLAVRGHFQGQPAWMDYPELLSPAMASLVGALPHEVVLMNTLTVNLHLMLASFYRPVGKRKRILIEEHAFPSDHHVVHSHLQMRDCEPAEDIVLVHTEPDSGLLSTDRIVETIRHGRDSLAMILLPGIQYYTGQVLAMKRITETAHEFEIPIGFDLAHAAGNIPMQLHDWGIDFACWCTYKYLNSGPGALGGCFIHERHARDTQRVRLAGWWGHDRRTRFQMAPEFSPPPTALGWQLSNPPILALAGIDASLRVFEQAGGIAPLRSKSLAMNDYFRLRLEDVVGDRVRVVTPRDPDEHGCQVSLEIQHEGTSGRAIYDSLEHRCVRADWREPNVIRAAPVPLYNSFCDIERFVQTLKSCLDD